MSAEVSAEISDKCTDAIFKEIPHWVSEGFEEIYYERSDIKLPEIPREGFLEDLFIKFMKRLVHKNHWSTTWSNFWSDVWFFFSIPAGIFGEQKLAKKC